MPFPALPLPAHPTLATVTSPTAQQRWHSTLDSMALLPGADPATLRRIRAWITEGITLDFVSPPEAIDHDNTSAVLAHASSVRVRLHDYIAFDAVVPLPPGHPRPFGIQPLHAIIKAGKKPRLVIDLSRNLNGHLQHEYFSYTSVRHAM